MFKKTGFQIKIQPKTTHPMTGSKRMSEVLHRMNSLHPVNAGPGVLQKK
jgi:hypothetical protein